MDIFSSRIKKTFSNVLDAVENIPNDGVKSHVFYASRAAIEVTDLMDMFSSRIENIKPPMKFMNND